MQKLVFAVLLAAISLSLYAPAKDFAFVWSDETEVVRNPALNPGDRGKVLSSFTKPSGNLYTPMALTGWAIQSRFAQDDAGRIDPKVFHTVNLGLHTANAILVLLILSFFFKSAFPAFIGATLFAIHPLQVEPVVWVSAFRELLAGFFGLVALWQYLHFARKLERESRRGPSPMPHFYVASGALLLALLSHPLAVVVPVAAFLLERLLPRKDSLSAPRRPLWPMTLWTLMAIPFVFVAVSLQETSALAAEVPFWAKPLIAGDAIAFYISKVFVPLGIGPDYGRSPTFLLAQWWGYLSWLTPLVLACTLLFWRENARLWMAAAVALLAIGVAPTLGLIAFESQGMSTVANRYAYLGMIGPALALAYFVSVPKRPTFTVIALVALGVYGWMTTRQLENWRDDETLWSHALAINPQSPIAHQVLADQNRLAGRLVEAKEHYKKVLEVNAVSPEPHFHLAEIERLSGNMKEAISLYERTLELDPNFPGARRNLGMALLAKGKTEAALAHFDEIAKSSPEDYLLHLSRGRALVETGRLEDAAASLMKALGSKDSSILASSEALLGMTLHKLGRTSEAKVHLTKALALEDGHTEAHRILGDLLYAEGSYGEALPHYDKAVEKITEDPELYRNLGRILLERKVYQRAAEIFEKAIALKPEDAHLHQDIATANFHLRRFDQATEQFKHALKLNPNLADAHYYLGDIARWSGKDEQALGRYYLALKIDKYHSKSHYRLGLHFMKEEKPKQALWHFNAALKNNPDDARIQAVQRRAQRAVEEETL